MTKENLRSEWAAKIEAFKASGQTQIAFCKEHDLNLKQMGYRLRKYRNGVQPVVDKKVSSWFTVEVKDSSEKMQSNSLNVRIGQAIIEVEPGFNQNLLIDVVKALRELC